ncbi:uncharacterized protein BT62DRAFT_969925 [Guyanagaster necrorhizus]|uniref:Aspartate/glutamate racemase family protein n=1 Tax=Guyanagaster necrorhizus TaxID=856835 RepID=A0A9P7VQ85_9AGAR|nr:uncharacterized protein BT62DRAFT_969925 [Guyanagaster necrorhizus MCA 3950]KAG7445411.1 hypothetical protein BT62DRAFT_969925 [Guyanagaster necrorhizus MCA 3950]
MSSTKKLGVLQLNTQFYRPPGDCGNLKSYAYPVVISIVEAATRETVVLAGREGQMALVDAFVKEGTRLMKEENVTCLITSCGFMAATHKELAERMPIPIGTSALLQVRWLRELFGGAPDTVGVITFSAENLTKDHFKGVALDVAPPVKGVPVGGAFYNWITLETEFDFAACEAEVVQAAKQIQKENPTIRAICFECTNMPPFTEAVKEATGLPVYSVLTLADWMYHASSMGPSFH